MMYFLDFDRTLFDTDTYNRDLADEPVLAPIKEELLAMLAAGRENTLGGGEARLKVWDKFMSYVEDGTLSFPPGHLAKYVYKDVPEFLRMLGNEAVIVTYGDKKRQELKIENAFAGIPRISAWYAQDKPKAEMLESRLSSYSAPLYFVDDNPIELARMAELCPQVRLFEMRRDGKEGDGRWTVVHSLSDLP